MNSLKSLYNRICKIETSIPPKPQVWRFDYFLLTEQEQEQFAAFMGSLPRPLDLKTLTDEQTRTFHYWLKLEKALRAGNSAEAEKLRRRYGVTLELLIDRFLHLDISSLPPAVGGGPGPTMQDGNAIYTFGRTWYRYLCMGIEYGRARTYRDDIWRWVEYFEHV